MSWHDRFIDRLCELARQDDRAALAALRRSLDEETASFAGAAQVVARSLPREIHTAAEADAYLIAALFALAPAERGLPLATCLRRVAADKESVSIELRFTSLLAASREDLPTHLRHAITLVRSQGLAVDWRGLFEDLRRWGHQSGKTQKQWARLFWGSDESPEVSTSLNEGTTP